MITACKYCGTILRVPFLLIKKWYSSDDRRLFDPMDVNGVLAFVATARLCVVDWSALDK